MRKIIIFLLLAVFFGAGCTLHRIDPNKGTPIEVAVFDGGYGLGWYRKIARSYEATHPTVKINLWGDPRVDQEIEPRILRGDPPDLANAGLPIWKLIVAGQLYPLDHTLDSPAYGQPGLTWRQTLVPGILRDFQYRGKTYAMPSNLGAWVCWYNERQFRRHGWKVPHTWGQFTRLCDQIKASGIAPLAFQGKYPSYAWPTLLSLYERLVPMKRWYAVQNLEPGAFMDPQFIHAARLLQQMAVRYFEPGALAMTHTESQMEWVNGRAALVFCGLWLENEMKNAIPPGFEMACFPVPTIKGGKGDPNAVYGGGGEDFFVFAHAKHPKLASDFLKYMLSKENSHSYIHQLDTLSPVRDSTRGITLSPELQSAEKIVAHCSFFFQDRLTTLYPGFGDTVLQDALIDLLANRITPEQFARRLEAGADKIRRDPDIYKPPPMDPPEE